jgi:hypothetical protein
MPRQRRTRKFNVCEGLEPRRLLAATLTSNTTTLGSIDLPAEQDSYEFAGVAGERVILSAGEGAAATPTFDPQIILNGTTGAQLQSSTGVSTAYIETVLPTTGTYGVVIKEFNNNTTGDYRLHFVKLPFTANPTDPFDGDGKVLASNSTTTAAIATAGDIDLYSFTAAVGDRIVLSMGEGLAAVTGFDPYLALYSPTGAQLQTDVTATSAFIEVTATTAGTYNVLAREYNNDTTGDYRLHFEKLPFVGNATDPADGDGKALVSNTTTTGAIATIGDLDLYTFSAAVGDHVVLSIGEGAAAVTGFDPDITLYSPTGALLQTTTGTVSGFIDAPITAAGTYTVLIREYNNNTTGDYRLYFDKLPFAGSATDPADGDGRALVSNTTTTGAIGSVGDLDLYSFNAAMGDRIILSVGEGANATAAFDPDMTLFSPTGAVVSTVLGTQSAYIEETITTAGRYNVLVREYNDDTTGDYRLHFVKLPFTGNPTDPADGDGQTLVSNTTINAAMGTVGDLDLYTFTAAAGDSFAITAGDTSGNAFTPQLTVYRPDGTVQATDTAVGGAGVELLSLTVAGTYSVLIDDYTDNHIGNYALHFIKLPGPQPIDPADQDGGALASGQSVTASLTAGDLDAYTFTLATGGSATVRASELGATAFFPQIDVFGPNGAQVGTNTGNASALVTLTNVTLGGTYTIVMHDFGDDNPGQYALALNATPGADTRAPAVVSNRFDYNTDRQQIVIALTEGIGGTLETSDLTLENVTTHTTISPDYFSATFNTLSNEIVFRFPGYSAGILPDGDYHATLNAGSLTDGAGNLLPSASSIDFFTYGGDANHDRSVDFNDLVALAQNYNTIGKTYVQGDFNYDGSVDFNDLVILAQQYNTTLHDPGAPPAPAAAGANFATDWAAALQPVATPQDGPDSTTSILTAHKKEKPEPVFNVRQPIKIQPAPLKFARAKRAS